MRRCSASLGGAVLAGLLISVVSIGPAAAAAKLSCTARVSTATPKTPGGTTQVIVQTAPGA